MLPSPKIPALTPVRRTHVDVFIEHYDRLKKWALQFTENDHALAEDLLHDAFIQFTLSKPDLDAVQNLEGYLFVVMRNLHLSQIRRATRSALRPVSLVEYDTVEVSFWSSDPRDRIRHWDELGAICQYACIRKESSKAGAVLILRFFHGYYPEEIAQVLRTNRSAIEKRLQVARGEARLFLEGPERLSFIGNKPQKPVDFISNPIGGDLRLELRKQIFASRRGDCMDHTDLERIYVGATDEGITHESAAHIVACEICLDSVNALLDLPLLATRYPLDTLGKDPGQKGGGGGTGGGTPGGGPHMFNSYERRADAYFHHQPQELHISVNGQLHGFQKVVAGKGEMTLMLDSPEHLGFVEIFSEQGMRLLMLNVEPPPVGEGKQAAHVELSSGRTVDAQLNFSGAHPALQVTYNDPELATMAQEITAAPNAANAAADSADDSAELFADVAKRPDWRRWFTIPRLVVAFSGLLLAALVGIWLINQPPKPLTASDVLANAATTESTMLASADKVLHRNYQVEQWVNGGLQSRRRVDQWQRLGISAERVYDENGKMVAGEWTADNGSRQLFREGARLTTLDAADKTTVTDIEPTVAGFKSLLRDYGVSASVTADDSSGAYDLNYRKPNSEPGGLLVASLIVDRNNYYPRSETLVIQVGDETREYRFSDIHVEQRPFAEVSPLIFQPEAELTGGATKVTKPLVIGPLDAPETAANTNTAPTANTTASLDTEVEVMRVLDSVNALSGDQISVTRTGAGQLKVSGIVDTPARKTEILNVLASVRTAAGVVIDIQTAAEAAARRKGSVSPSDITVESVATDVNTQLPVEAELKAHFAKRGLSGEALGTEIKNYAEAVQDRSRALRRDALALKSLAERFSPAEIERLEPAKKDQWRSLLRSKAAAVAGDVRSLNAQLSAVGLNTGGEGSSGAAAIRDSSDPAEAAQRLFGLAAACDAQVQQSFSISGSGRGSASVKTVQFWRNLAQMAAISSELQRF